MALNLEEIPPGISRSQRYRGKEAPTDQSRPIDRFRAWAVAVDWVPDLGADIGSASWWRGAATCAALVAFAWSLGPSFRTTLPGLTPPPLTGADYEEVRAQSIAPLAYGATSGRRMAANDLVRPLTETPERPIIDATATLGDGDDFKAALQRAGVGRDEAAQTASLVSDAVSLGDLKPGTRLELTLGRRENKLVARPLEHLSFRAKFDLSLAVNRKGNELALTRQPIAIDHTPLRIDGVVGESLYRSARAAGAPAGAVADYLKALATRLSIGRDIDANDRFQLVIGQSKAATGEVQTGDLELAGIVRNGRALDLVRWGENGHTQWYDAKGTGQSQGQMALPVAGHITSTFGMRFHPILHLMRMHKGIDIGAAYGSPIHAAADGRVVYAGRKGGYGNFVQLQHGSGLATDYAHMSRIAVRPGQHVSRGEVIGYVGSSGQSTGPHLHWEVLKNGIAVNPQSFSFASVERLSGQALRAFRNKVAELLGSRQQSYSR